MVPSIYPLETLHNSLSLKQVNEFLGSVCESAGDPHTRTTRGQKHSEVKCHVSLRPNLTPPALLVSSPQLCRPCSPHTTSRRWTRTSLRGSSHPPCLSDLAPTDPLGVSIAGARRSSVSLSDV